MAKTNVTEQSNQLNLTVVALVALVAIVGVVALVLYTANVAVDVSTGARLASADDGVVQDSVDVNSDEENVVGDATVRARKKVLVSK